MQGAGVYYFFSVFIKNKNRKKGLWFLCFSFFFFPLFLERLVASSSGGEGWGVLTCLGG